MVPNAYTPVNTVRPNASETPRNPMPTDAPSETNLAANTALPQPPKTSQNVPMNSAASRCDIVGAVIAVTYLGISSLELPVTRGSHVLSRFRPVVAESAPDRDPPLPARYSPIAWASTGLLRVTMSGSALVKGNPGRSSMCTLNVAARTSRE